MADEPDILTPEERAYYRRVEGEEFAKSIADLRVELEDGKKRAEIEGRIWERKFVRAFWIVAFVASSCCALGKLFNQPYLFATGAVVLTMEALWGWPFAPVFIRVIFGRARKKPSALPPTEDA